MTITDDLTLAPHFWDAATALPAGPLRRWVLAAVDDDVAAAGVVQRAEARFGTVSLEAITWQIEAEAGA